MTPEELIKDLDACIKGAEYGPYEWGFKALRAIAELHKPCDMRCDGSQDIADADGEITYIPGPKDCSACTGCQYDYPCRTIETIEKELA